MKIAILRESKTDGRGRPVENRVILTPDQVKKLIHTLPTCLIMVEAKAGEKIGYPDRAYEAVGAKMTSHIAAMHADIVLGVKETEYVDFHNLNRNIIISFQHFAASEYRTKKALKSRAGFVCLETIEVEKHGKSFFPCLAPMSEAAAKVVARHADMFALLKSRIISSGLSHKSPERLKVVIVGAGNVGLTASKEFSARGMEVHTLDKISIGRLPAAIKGAFFAVSAMYTSGKKPKKVITCELLKTMAPGGCVYPVDIDQGSGIEGVKETSILTPFDLPKIKGTDIYYFAPPNLPSLGAATASEALGEAVLPYVIEIAKKGLDKAAEEDPSLKAGINIQNGKIIHPGLASVFPKY